MNRFYNALLLAIFAPTLFFGIYVGFDLPIRALNATGAFLPYNKEIFLVLGGLSAIVNFRRSIRRWTGLRLVGQVDKYTWNQVVSKERVTRVWTYNILEAMVMGSVGYGLYQLTPMAWLPAVALWYGAVDNILFSIVGTVGKKFRVGLTTKAILVADRDVTVLYFSGLRKVEKQQDSLFFTYTDGLELDFPLNCIQKEHRRDFFLNLREVTDSTKVYFGNDIPRNTEKDEQ